MSGLMEETQKHTIAEILYFIGDTYSSKQKAWNVVEGPLEPS